MKSKLGVRIRKHGRHAQRRLPIPAVHRSKTSQMLEPALYLMLWPALVLADYLGMRIANYKLETVEVSDFRVLRMQEILLAIKLVKFYTWEKSFARQVSDVSGVSLSQQVVYPGSDTQAAKNSAALAKPVLACSSQLVHAPLQGKR